MNDELWNQWVAESHWITDAMHRHGCNSTTPVIAPPALPDTVAKTERECGIILPRDFVRIVTHYSAFVILSWSSDRLGVRGEWKKFPSPFSCTFSSGGEYLWNIADYSNTFDGFRMIRRDTFPAEPTEFYADVWDDAMAEYHAHWHNKLPLIETPNGDFIAFDLLQGSDEGRPLVYLSHDGANTHGMQLANNFIDFITTWSRVGCVGPEEWVIKRFHDEAAERLVTDGELGDRFREIINEPEPWFPGAV